MSFIIFLSLLLLFEVIKATERLVFLEKAFWQQCWGWTGGGENGGKEAVRSQACGRHQKEGMKRETEKQFSLHVWAAYETRGGGSRELEEGAGARVEV